MIKGQPTLEQLPGPPIQTTPDDRPCVHIQPDTRSIRAHWRQSPRTVETRVEWILSVLLSACFAGRRSAPPAAGVKAGRRPPQGVALTPARTGSGSLRTGAGPVHLRPPRRLLAQGVFEVERAEHAQRGVPPVAVVLLDPGRDPVDGPGPWWRISIGRQLELHRGVQGSMTALSSAYPANRSACWCVGRLRLQSSWVA